jgi:prepilin-type N-terminal cleavage/methylation domain-containing protein
MKNRGFTLVELILTMGMLGVMVGMMAPWMINAVKSYDLISTRRLMLGEVRAGFDRMIREIRLIPGQSQIIATSASSFQFQYPTGTSITYSLTGTNLMRNSDILMNNVTALAFTYYDQSGNTTTTPSSVRSVTLQVTATTTSSSTPYTVRTRVFVRNTGNHYTNFTSP